MFSVHAALCSMIAVSASVALSVLADGSFFVSRHRCHWQQREGAHSAQRNNAPPGSVRLRCLCVSVSLLKVGVLLTSPLVLQPTPPAL